MSLQKMPYMNPESSNKRYTQIALFGQFGLHKTPVGRALNAGTPFVGFSPPAFFCFCKTAAQFLLSKTKKRQLFRTLCAICAGYILN